DRAPSGERQRDAEPVVEVLPDEAPPPEGEEQRHAADHGRQHHRQQDERPHEATAGEAGSGQGPRKGQAEGEGERGGPYRADEREPQRVPDDRVGQIVRQLRPGRALEEPDERNDEERDCDRGEDGDDDRGSSSAASHGGRNPNFLSVFWPSFDITNCTHAFAAVAFPLAFTPPLGEVATTVTLSGIPNTLVVSFAALHSL